jgi:hypothetical protein
MFSIRRGPTGVALTVAVASAVLYIWLRADGAPETTRTAARPVDLPEPGRLVLPRAPGSLRFAVMGDVGHGNRLQYETAEELARWHERFDFEFVLLTGDNIYGPGTVEDYRTRFEIPYQRLLDRDVAFFAAPGNHDPPNIVHYPPFNMNGERYYAFDREFGLPLARQRARFVALDTINLDRTQLAWTREQLGEATDWTVVFLHYPLYTSGRYWFRARRTRGTLEPLFVDGGVDVVFSGHEHLYERVRPQHGVQYFTSGSGGDVRVGDLEPSSIHVNGFDRDAHFMLIEIAGDALHFQVVARTGATVDLGAVARDARDRMAADRAPPVVDQ